MSEQKISEQDRSEISEISEESALTLGRLRYRFRYRKEVNPNSGGSLRILVDADLVVAVDGQVAHRWHQVLPRLLIAYFLQLGQTTPAGVSDQSLHQISDILLEFVFRGRETAIQRSRWVVANVHFRQYFGNPSFPKNITFQSMFCQEEELAPEKQDDPGLIAVKPATNQGHPAFLITRSSLVGIKKTDCVTTAGRAILASYFGTLVSALAVHCRVQFCWADRRRWGYHLGQAGRIDVGQLEKATDIETAGRHTGDQVCDHLRDDPTDSC